MGVYLFACLFSALNSIDEIPKQHSKRKMCATILAAVDFVVLKSTGFLGTFLSAKQIKVL